MVRIEADLVVFGTEFVGLGGGPIGLFKDQQW